MSMSEPLNLLFLSNEMQPIHHKCHNLVCNPEHKKGEAPLGNSDVTTLIKSDGLNVKCLQWATCVFLFFFFPSYETLTKVYDLLQKLCMSPGTQVNKRMKRYRNLTSSSCLAFSEIITH